MNKHVKPHQRRLSRRMFLKVGGIGAGLALLEAACRPLNVTLTATPVSPTHHAPTVESVPTHQATASPLSTPGVWAGRVRDGSGSPITNARITLLSADGNFFREARTDATGQYAIPDAPVGSFALGASALG